MIFAAVSSAYPFEYKLGKEIDQRFYMESNYFNPSTLRFDQDDRYNILSFIPYLSFSREKSLEGFLLADIFWIYSMDSDIEDNVDVELINAYIDLSIENLSTRIGLQPFQLGRGHILDYYEPGVSVKYTNTSQTYINATAALLFDSSSVLSLSFGYQPGFLEKIEIFGAGFQDKDNCVAEMLNQAPSFEGVQSTGNLYWYGVEADLFILGFFISGTGIIQDGSVTLDKNSIKRESDISAFLLDVGVSHNINQDLSGTIFLFVSSGDPSPKDNRFKFFISPMPYNQRAAIFLSDGLGRQDATEALFLNGITTAGVISPGLTFDYRYADRFFSTITFALLFPEEKPTDAQEWYGWEADLFVSYSFGTRHTFFFETDFFKHGDFFEYRQDGVPDYASLVMMGYKMVF